MNKEKWLEEQKLSKLKKTCCNCKYYDNNSYCCMYQWAVLAILDETKSAQRCSNFEFGEYNENDLGLGLINFHQY